MQIQIKYNEGIDEFTEDISLSARISRYINKHFYPAYAISDLAPIYLVGGAIRDLMCAKHPKDMDFVVLGKVHMDWVIEVLDRYGIQVTFNRFGGYKFVYNGTHVDLWLAEDLFSAMQYNVDGLFWDLNTKSLLSLTFEDFTLNGIRLVNPQNNIENGREQKLIKFSEKYFKN